METALLCCQHRKRYMQLALGRRIVDGESGLCDELSPTENEEFDAIERLLPLEALAVFRELSVKEALVRNHLSKRTAEKKKALAASNYNSWLWLGVGFTHGTNTGDFSPETSSEEEDLTLDSFHKFFETPSPDSPAISPSSFTMDLTLQSSSSLQLSIDSRPLCRLNMSLTLDGFVRLSGVSFIFQMKELLMVDEYTTDPLIRNLISIKPDQSIGIPRAIAQLTPLSFEKKQYPFVIQFEAKKEKTKVTLTALPLEVCLNKLCIQQIIGMFQVAPSGRPLLVSKSPSPLNSGVRVDQETAAAALVSSNNEFLSASTFEFVFEAEAPKIIVPEHSSVEKGYLLLDTGHLSVKGALSSSGMWWEISLKAVNAGLPLLASEMYIFSEQSLYLIRPFNVHTTVQTYNKSVADMTVTVAIDPSICGEIDAIKLSRVMHLIQVVSATFRPNTVNPSPTPTSQIQTNLEQDLFVDAKKCSILIEAQIPEVSLVMNYNNLENHFGILSIHQLSCRVELRPYDFQVLVDLKGLTLEDSLRFDEQKYVISSPNRLTDVPQIHISYVSMSHKGSPFYDAHAIEVLVAFTRLHLHIDPHSIMFLRPFYEVILGKRLQSYPLDLDSSMSSSATLDITPNPGGVIRPSGTNIPTGMHVIVSFEVIACELLRSSGSGGNILEGSLHAKLLTMFLIDIYRLRVEVRLDQLISADVHIHSTNIADTREISNDYYFKTIVKPSQSENCLNLSKEALSQTSASEAAMMSQETSSQLLITYKQESSTNSFVDIIVRDITGYLSLDTVLDLLDVSLTNTFAALDLVKPLDKTSDLIAPSYSDSDSRKTNINVHVSIPNPQLILLEDPMRESTRGIIGRCGIDVKYNRETVFGKNVEINEAIHLSVMDNEIFVVSNMQRWNPHQILFPMTLELHINRAIESNMVISNSFAFDMDTIAADVSLNDILLAQSIMLRRALIQPSPSTPQPALAAVSTDSCQRHQQMILTAYLVNINIGSVFLTMVNDFQGKHLPLVKIKLDGITFSCDGIVEDLRGEGSLILSVESFNNKVASWEPLIDPWHPRFIFFNSSAMQSFEIKSEHTLQLSISSTFLETIRQTQSILFSLRDNTDNRTAIPTVTFQNRLGIPVDLVNSSTQSTIFHLEPSEVASIYLIHQTTGYLYPQQQTGTNCVFMTALPEAVDIVLDGEIGASRLPVTRLSLKLTKPKRYLIPAREIRLLDDDRLASSSAMRSVPSSSQSTDPIVEEVFECERYNPLTGEWDTPFLVGDPPRWTESSGVNERLRENVLLPSNGQWEWSSPWTLDKFTEEDATGSPDPRGWRYSRNFNSFASTSHHVSNFMDSVRRRRWYRIRAPVLTSSMDPSRPLSMIWDSHLLEDGSKVIKLRTFLQIQNDLSYPVSVLLLNKSWPQSVEVGPIKPKDLLAIPLLFVHATSMQIKPNDHLAKWSQEVRCTLSTNNHTNLQDILCFDTNSNYPVPIRTITQQEEKSVLISLHSPIQIINSLPCQLRLRFFNSLDLRNISGTIICVEEILVPAGSSANLRNISLTCEVVVSVNVGNYGWSQPRVLKRGQAEDFYNISYAHANGTIAFQIQLLFLRSLHQSCEIHLYSEWALVDRTGLDISILANGNASGTRKIQRYSYVPGLQGSRSSSKTRLTLSSGIASSSASDTMSEESCRNTVARISDLVVKSSHPYPIGTVDIEGTVYSDRDSVFSYLPFLFRGQTFIQTCCSDTSLLLHDSSLIEFRVNQSSIVVVLIDKKLKIPPPWLMVSGFKRIYDQCIASPTLASNSPDTHYSIYGKLYQSQETVSLGYQYTTSKAEVSMYCVLILPGEKNELNATLLSQLRSNEKADIAETELCWVHGNKGMSLFSTADGIVSIGLNHGTVWTSKGINLRVLGTAKGPFDVHDQKLNKSYQLAYNIVPMPGIFYRTKVLTIMPRYCIVNCSDEPLEIRQRGSKDSMYIEPFACDSWHKLDAACQTAVHVKCLSSKWSFGSVDLNEVGSVELLLPPIEEPDPSNHIFPSSIVMNINVQIADPEDNCAVVIVMWKSKPNGYSSLSIRNDSRTPITIRQGRLQILEKGVDRSSCFEVHVSPHTWVPFGWTDPDGTKQIQLSTSETFLNNHRIATIDLQTFTQRMRIPYGSPRKGLMKEVVLSIESLGSGRVIQVVEATDSYESIERSDSDELHLPSPVDVSSNDCGEHDPSHQIKERRFQLFLTSIGLSIVADFPKRKEFLSLYVENLTSKYTLIEDTKTRSFIYYEIHVEDIQIDNYSETAVYPVLFRKVKTSRRHRSPTPLTIMNSPSSGGDLVFDHKDDNALISFAFCKEVCSSNPLGVRYSYLTLRILEFAIEVDSGTIQQFFSIFFNEIKVMSRDDILAMNSPEHWIQSYSTELLSIENRFQYVDIYKSQLKAQESKLYFQHLIFHPIKILLTFLQTEYDPQHSQTGGSLASPHRKTISSSILDLVTSAVAVELMEIKLNSFIVTDAHESVATLQTRIFTKMWHDVRGQLATIAGSLSILGSPAGLVRNIGNGVQDFFYEPYLGLVQSPEEFLIGIKNGTSSLMVGVVAGTLNSTATLIGTASSGFSYLSGDSDFIKQRLLSRQKIHASRHGAFDSLKDGSEQVILGITSGVSGIFTKPYEEARKDGAMGFLRGVGFGVVGAAVKPVLGLADGISSLAHGISNELGDSSATHQVRPARALARSVHDPSVLLLTPLNLISAEAQHFIKLQAFERHLTDEFIADFKVKRNSQIILTESFLYWRVKETPMVSFNWAEISHCVYLGEQVGLYLYGGGSHSNNSGTNNGTNGMPLAIPCRNEDRAVQLYALFVKHAYLFGNPSMIIPLDLALAKMPSPVSTQATSILTTAHESMFRECVGDQKPNNAPTSIPENISVVGLLDGYKFGSFEMPKSVRFENLNETELLAKVRDSLLSDSQHSLQELDATIHWLISQWDIYHAATRVSRCSVTIVLNRSANAIQIMSTHLKTGRQVLIFGPTSYEEDSRSILPGGCVVVFCCGITPSFLDPGKVLLHLTSSGFEATLSSTVRETTCRQLNGYSVGFLEKSSTEWWSKYVILVQ
jgi:hypothetical protein